MSKSRGTQALPTMIFSAVSIAFLFVLGLVALPKFAPVLDSLTTEPGLELRVNKQPQRSPRRQDVSALSAPRLERESDAARMLVNSIQDSSRKTAEALGVDVHDGFTAEEFDEWNQLNPCSSRANFHSMYDPWTHRETLPLNIRWEELLSEYTKLHRLCTLSIADPEQHFLTGNGSSGCKFAITNVGRKGVKSVGEKLLANASILLYAILTKRVLLVASTTLIPECICEPFAGSSWVLNAANFPLDEHSSSISHNRSWMPGSEFFDRVGKCVHEIDGGESSRWKATCTAWKNVQAVSFMDDDYGPSGRFLCQTEQSYLSEVTWLQFPNAFPSIPCLFAAPPFRTTLEALFPDKIISPYLLRSTHLPSDAVWERAWVVHRAYVGKGDRVVGLQLNISDSELSSKDTENLLTERLIGCTTRNSILPEVKRGVHPSFALHSAKSVNFKQRAVVTIYVASPTPKLLTHFSRHFMRSSTESGERVATLQISPLHASMTRESDGEKDERELAEIILLSSSDQLVVTPGSSFGRLAQAYGCQTPWVLEVGDDPNLPACKRGQHAEYCVPDRFQSNTCPDSEAHKSERTLKGLFSVGIGTSRTTAQSSSRLHLLPSGSS